MSSNKPDLTRVDSGIVEHSPPDSGHGDSVDVGSEIYKSGKLLNWGEKKNPQSICSISMSHKHKMYKM